MKLFNLIKKFRGDEDGAVTVDWVVLTAAIVGLGIVVMNTVGTGVTGVADKVATNLGNIDSGYAANATASGGH